jgi:transposase
MGEISTIGLDLAKHVFQVHGVDEQGQAVVRRQLRRGAVLKFFAELPPCTVGIEACGSAHYWAREIMALGHRVKLMPPAYVKPYVKRGKNDAADAEAICEAVMRPTMRFVPVKSAEQQADAMIFKVRELLVRQRTQLTNALRSHLAELGVVAAQGAIDARIAPSARATSRPFCFGAEHWQPRGSAGFADNDCPGRPFKVAAGALAHKMAPIVWALMVKGGSYRAAKPAVAIG